MILRIIFKWKIRWSLPLVYLPRNYAHISWTAFGICFLSCVSQAFTTTMLEIWFALRLCHVAGWCISFRHFFVTVYCLVLQLYGRTQNGYINEAESNLTFWITKEFNGSSHSMCDEMEFGMFEKLKTNWFSFIRKDETNL